MYMVQQTRTITPAVLFSVYVCMCPLYVSNQAEDGKKINSKCVPISKGDQQVRFSNIAILGKQQ